MSNRRLPASDLYLINEQDIEGAISRIDAGIRPPRFSESKRFDLLHDGKRYPPKAVVALAAERSLKRVLDPDDISGGESTATFRVILERGFEVVTKAAQFGLLDASFSVGRNRDGTFLIMESRGPARNTDYMAGLESALYGLANLDATISDIWIDSEQTRPMARETVRLHVASQSFPIRLREQKDLLELRRAITRTAAETARNPSAIGGGNPTKRLRLEIDLPKVYLLMELRDLLTSDISKSSDGSFVFEFAPRSPGQGRASQTSRKPIEGTVIEHMHIGMQDQLYRDLVRIHGEENVAAEHLMACGRPADLVVCRQEGLEIYEIKTALAPKDCVRQALGQLLEYGCWPGSPSVAKFVVVGPTEIDDATSSYLEALMELFSIPIEYLWQPEQSKD